jgi:hypothetical protein
MPSRIKPITWVASTDRHRICFAVARSTEVDRWFRSDSRSDSPGKHVLRHDFDRRQRRMCVLQQCRVRNGVFACALNPAELIRCQTAATSGAGCVKTADWLFSVWHNIAITLIDPGRGLPRFSMSVSLVIVNHRRDHAQHSHKMRVGIEKNLSKLGYFDRLRSSSANECQVRLKSFPFVL